MSDRRVTPEIIESKIKNVEFIRNGVLTIAVVELVNGFKVTGESACADPENYNQELGERYAREAAIEKIWPLEGYLLRQELYEEDKLNRFQFALSDLEQPEEGMYQLNFTDLSNPVGDVVVTINGESNP